MKKIIFFVKKFQHKNFSNLKRPSNLPNMTAAGYGQLEAVDM